MRNSSHARTKLSSLSFDLSSNDLACFSFFMSSFDPMLSGFGQRGTMIYVDYL